MGIYLARFGYRTSSIVKTFVILVLNKQSKYGYPGPKTLVFWRTLFWEFPKKSLCV
jgi:hypothetical protein